MQINERIPSPFWRIPIYQAPFGLQVLPSGDLSSEERRGERIRIITKTSGFDKTNRGVRSIK